MPEIRYSRDGQEIAIREGRDAAFSVYRNGAKPYVPRLADARELEDWVINPDPLVRELEKAEAKLDRLRVEHRATHGRENCATDRDCEGGPCRGGLEYRACFSCTDLIGEREPFPCQTRNLIDE